MPEKSSLVNNGKRFGETEELLRSYFDAFSNLYGITPLYRAFRIIQKQNPNLQLTEKEFLAFADKASREEHYYIIAGAEDIYCDIKEPTPPMKREIITEYLYAVDDFESYEELKAEQADKPFYIPEKEVLLRYQDSGYVEETEASLALGTFLRDKLKLKRVSDILEDLQLMARMGDNDPQTVIGEVVRLEGKKCFFSTAQINELFQYYIAMYNHTRLDSNRGFTPTEMQERMGGRPSASFEFGPNTSCMFQTGKMDIGELRQGIGDANLPVPWKAGILKDLKYIEKKPSLNGPCPCGSGKKYKRCCGKQKRTNESD